MSPLYCFSLYMYIIDRKEYICCQNRKNDPVQTFYMPRLRRAFSTCGHRVSQFPRDQWKSHTASAFRPNVLWHPSPSTICHALKPMSEIQEFTLAEVAPHSNKRVSTSPNFNSSDGLRSGIIKITYAGSIPSHTWQGLQQHYLHRWTSVRRPWLRPASYSYNM